MALRREVPCLITTLFFRMGDAGWSERYYLKVVSYQAAQIETDTLITHRRKLMYDDVTIQYVRISENIKRGDALVGTNGQTGSRVLTGGKSTEPWTALLLRLESGPERRGFLYLRGIPDDLCAGGKFTPDAAWDTAFTAYRDWMLSACTNLAKVNPLKTDYALYELTAVKPVRLASRRIGRPFGLPRGRRPC